MEFEVKIDTKQLEEMTKAAKEFAPKAIERANRDAINKGNTMLRKQMLKKYVFSKEEFEKYVRKKDTCIIAKSELLTVGEGKKTHFRIAPRQYSSQANIKVNKRKKVALTIKKKNKKRLNHVFIANPNSPKIRHTMLWERGDYGIMPFRTISVAQMTANREILDPTMNVMMETQQKRLEHYIEREIEKHADH